MESRFPFTQHNQHDQARRPSSKTVAFQRPSCHDPNDHNNDENTPLRPRPTAPAPLQSLDALLDPSPALPFPQRAGIRFAHRATSLRFEVLRKATQGEGVEKEHQQEAKIPREELGESNPRRGTRSPWLEKLKREVWGAGRENQDAREISSKEYEVPDGAGRSSREELVVPEELAEHSPPSALPFRKHARARLPSPPAQLSPSLAPRPSPLLPVLLSTPSLDDSARLSTVGLPPIRHRLRTSGTIEILPSSHEVLLDLRSRNNGVILISGDGSSLSYFDHAGPLDGPLLLLHPTATYPHHSLPPKHRKHYALATKFLSTLRSKAPLLIHFPPPTYARQTIFSDSPPSYTVVHPQTTLLLSRSQSLLRLSNPPRAFPLPLSPTSLALLSPSEQAAVQNALALAPQIDALATTLRAAVPLPPPPPPFRPPTTSYLHRNVFPPTRVPTSRILRAALSSPPPSLPEEERRYLPGAGWILRTGEQYVALFANGEEVRLREGVVEIGARRWRMDEVLPGKVESRVALVREMMMLF